MVQVDVFWAYSFGASLAMASGRQLAKLEQPFYCRYFVWTLLFLALAWAPTGMLLLLRHPSWETMQVAEDLQSIPALLTLGFGISNITQGILGFWTGYLLMRAGKVYLANLNWMLGYFGMFFILVYGWDGLGLDRFLYDRDMLSGSPAWTPGAGTDGTAGGTLAGALQFLTSSVALTLYLDGAWLLPPFFALMYRWHAEGLRAQGEHLHFWLRAPKWLLAYLGGVFVLSLGAAIFCAVIVNYTGALLGVGDHIARARGDIAADTGLHVLSYLIGLPLGLGLLWVALLRRNGLAHRMLSVWCHGDKAHPRRLLLAAD